MTRILYWNIEKFSFGKFAGTPAGFWRRQNVLQRVLAATQPDIIVIIEVSTGTWPGNVELATVSAGLRGCNHLLALLRHPALGFNAPPAQWRLVPPLRVGEGGRRETVGVFYRGTSVSGGVNINRYFTGPNRWTTALGPSREAGPGVASHPYPLSHTAYLQPARAIPAGSQYNGGIAETEVAARISFSDLVAGPGTPWPYGDLRQPYMVTFVEEDAATGNILRNLTLFAVHAPPYALGAAGYMYLLSQTLEVGDPAIGANEVRVLCGDFNLNLLDQAGVNADPYALLTPGAAGYTVLLPGAPLPPGIPLDQWRGFFTTHVKKPHQNPVFWSVAAHQSPYPGYGYTDDTYYSIDNILVRRPPPAPGAPGAGPSNFTIMNTVVGTPFAVTVPGAPPGTIAMQSAFARAFWPHVPAGAPVPPNIPFAPQYRIGDASTFRSRDNYGHVTKTSDHFALYAEV